MKHQSAHTDHQADEQALHEERMRQALVLARQAADLDETPIGALIVKDGRIVGKGFNLREKEQDGTMHAEMIAIRDASRQTGSWRLEGCTLYVTLEPCIMCAGAIVQARLDRVVFGAYDPKAGAAGSITNIFAIRQNHQVQVTGGVESLLCGQIIRHFFADLRKKKKAAGSRAVRRQQAIRKTAAKQPDKQRADTEPTTEPSEPSPASACDQPACGNPADSRQNCPDTNRSHQHSGEK